LIPSRPITLWDQRVFTHNQFDELKRPQDEWGRSEAFCSHPSTDDIQEHTNEKGEKEQIHLTRHGNDQDHMNIGHGKHDCSEKLLEQFLNSHYMKNDDSVYTRSSKKFSSDHFIANFETSGACIESSLL
jgi:hypothetical protein